MLAQEVPLDILTCDAVERELHYLQEPSRRYGEEVGAFIILQPGVTLKPEDIREFCRGRIAWHKVPRYVEFVAEFPMNAAGKILKYKMREAAVEKLSLQADSAIETA